MIDSQESSVHFPGTSSPVTDSKPKNPFYDSVVEKLNLRTEVIFVSSEKVANIASRFASKRLFLPADRIAGFSKSEMTAFATKTIYLCPDVGVEGQEKMIAFGRQLKKAGSSQVFVVNNPLDAPVGWNISHNLTSITSKDESELAEAAEYLIENHLESNTALDVIEKIGGRYPLKSPTPVKPTPREIAIMIRSFVDGKAGCPPIFESIKNDILSADSAEMLARLVRGIDEFKYETRADLLEAFTGEGFARQADRKIKRPPASETSTVAAREQDDIGLAPGEINDIICDFFTEVVVPKRLVIFNEQVWGYDEGINAYVLQSPKKAEKCVQNLVVMWRTTNADLDPKEISAIKLGVYEKLPFVTSENILLTTREPKEHWVAVRNGIVDIQAYLQDRPPLLPKNPDFFTTSAIDCNYDPSAEAPLYQMVTSEVLSEEQKRHFEEFVGYAIGKTRIKQNGLLIIGPKDSGKSTITEPVVDLFNSQAVCSVQPSEMRPGSFALQSFVGAQLNRLTEVASKRMCPTTVKQILACEDITINPKGIAQFRYLTRAAHLWACNPGNFEYRDEAFDSRLSIIVLVKSIKTKDPRFQQAGFWKQSGEMPGIFNIGLRGLKRLHERGYKFIEPDSSLQMKKALLLESDPMAAFIHDNLEYEKDAVTYSDDAYIAYCEEIKYTAHRAKTKRQFSDAVMREFSGRGVVSINTRRNGVQVRAYKNLSFRSSTDTPPPEAQEIAEENKIVLREIGRLVDALKRETREYEWDQEAIRFLLHEADETLKRACTV